MLALLGTVLLVAFTTVGRAPDAYAEGAKQSVSGLIKKGQDLFDEQLYEESIQTLSAALMRPGIGKTEKVEVYRLLAYNYIALQRNDEADAAVRGLLVLDESFELPDTESPRFRDVFKSVRKKWIAEGKPGTETTGETERVAANVVIKHTSPAQVEEAGLGVSLTGTIDDPKAVIAKVKLYFRQGSSEKFKAAKVTYTMRKFTAEIPGEAVQPPLVEYYLEALDEKGLPVASRGDIESPLRIAVPEGTSWYESPWFWVPVGVVVVGAIIVGVVLGTSQTPSSAVTVNVFD